MLREWSSIPHHCIIINSHLWGPRNNVNTNSIWLPSISCGIINEVTEKANQQTYCFMLLHSNSSINNLIATDQWIVNLLNYSFAAGYQFQKEKQCVPWKLFSSEHYTKIDSPSCSSYYKTGEIKYPTTNITPQMQTSGSVLFYRKIIRTTEIILDGEIKNWGSQIIFRQIRIVDANFV